MSAQGQTVKDMTTLKQVGEDHVRDVIHTSDEQEWEALAPKKKEQAANPKKGGHGGRPRLDQPTTALRPVCRCCRRINAPERTPVPRPW
ncbi:hypothetical protein ABZS88_39650 [Streptomyces sp. NPDC005480]|uniref:hypothetical protein n=1 Tax=Streptomyces sp. NPDC005480 TaxID=3154880 RepID=UPI0033AD9130